MSSSVASIRAARNSARIPPGSTSSSRTTLLPHFDTPYAAQLVLGQHWRNATPEQRKRFVEAFYKSLLYTYGDAMVDFTGDRLKVFPTKVAPEDTKATVRTEIKRSNGTKVAVNYSMRKVNGAWKAWDVVIDGISYVKSYREDYGAEVQQTGTGCRHCPARGQGREREVRQGRNQPERMKREAANNQRVGISESTKGRVVVTGELTFATARDARQLGVLVLESSARRAHRHRLQRRHARGQRGTRRVARLAGLGPAHSRPVSLQNLPASLLAIARISEVDELLTATG